MSETLKVDVVDPKGKKTGSVELPGELFDVPTNVPLIHQVVVAQLAAARQGTHAVKNRAAVSGGGKKPYRQKGTGRARQGSIRAPQFTGGGVVHGPQPRSYAQRTPKKMIRGALLGSISDRARNGRVHVITKFIEEATPSTKTAKSALANMVEERTALVVLDRTADQISLLSLRNLPQVHVLWADQLNAYDVLVSEDLVFTTSALDAFVGKKDKEESK